MKKTIDEITGYYGPLLAEQALEMGAIRLSPDDPFQWASGYRMPIYNDNRQFLAKAQSRKLICDAFVEMLESLDYRPENIAGTSTAGIPHATTLADRLQLPLTYVRSAGKDHGLHQQIEGLGRSGSYGGCKVVLIEDLVSTGGSSIKAVEAIVAAGGNCPHCLAIFTYGLQASVDAFAALTPPCDVHTILNYDIMVSTAQKTGYVDANGAILLHEWRQDPFGWGEKHGFPPVK